MERVTDPPSLPALLPDLVRTCGLCGRSYILTGTDPTAILDAWRCRPCQAIERGPRLTKKPTT